MTMKTAMTHHICMSNQRPLSCHQVTSSPQVAILFGLFKATLQTLFCSATDKKIKKNNQFPPKT